MMTTYDLRVKSGSLHRWCNGRKNATIHVDLCAWEKQNSSLVFNVQDVGFMYSSQITGWVRDGYVRVVPNVQQ